MVEYLEESEYKLLKKAASFRYSAIACVTGDYGNMVRVALYADGQTYEFRRRFTRAQSIYLVASSIIKERKILFRKF